LHGSPDPEETSVRVCVVAGLSLKRYSSFGGIPVFCHVALPAVAISVAVPSLAAVICSVTVEICVPQQLKAGEREACHTPAPVLFRMNDIDAPSSPDSQDKIQFNVHAS